MLGLARKQKRKPYYSLNSPGVSFTRTSSAYDGAGNLYNSGAPRLIPGQGLLIEEGTTNLIANPLLNIDSNADGVADNWNVGGSNATYSRSVSANGQRITVSAITSAYGYANVYQDYITTSGTYSALFKLNVLSITAPASVQCVFQWLDSSFAILRSDSVSTVVIGQQTLKLENKTAPANTARLRVRVFINDPNGAGTGAGDVVVQAVQLEAKPYATTFVNGTRSVENLTIPATGVLNPQEGTVGFAVIPNYASSVVAASGYGFTDLGFLNGSAYSGFLLRRKQNLIELAIGTGSIYSYYSYSTTWNANTKLSLAVKWDSANTFVLLNGQTIIAAPKFSTTNLPSTLMIGGRNDGYNAFGDALYGNINIYNRALSDSEAADLAAGKLVAPGNLRFIMKF